MKTVTFIDSIGRTIIGEDLGTENGVLSVKNPSMINVVQQQNGQLQVQLIPLFFAEFIDASTRSTGTVWKYNVSNIALGDVKIDARLLEQYSRAFGAAQPAQGSAPTIKLFDE